VLYLRGSDEKKGGISIYHQFLQKVTQLERQITDLQKQIKKLPRGKLICTRNGNYYKWYRSNGKKKTYIPKSNRRLAQQLAKKTYLSNLLEDKLNEKESIQFYLKHHSKFPKSEQVLQIPEFRELLEDYFMSFSEKQKQWCRASYEKNPHYPEHLTHKSSSGNCVRSKAECLIDTMLYIKHIPFRYECALQLGEATIYPDFTIQHPKTGAIYYWEHFGMMDNPDYAQKALSKQKLYAMHGIIPSHQLIVTYETSEKPLGSEEIEQIIEKYFS